MDLMRCESLAWMLFEIFCLLKSSPGVNNIHSRALAGAENSGEKSMFEYWTSWWNFWENVYATLAFIHNKGLSGEEWNCNFSPSNYLLKQKPTTVIGDRRNGSFPYFYLDFRFEANPCRIRSTVYCICKTGSLLLGIHCVMQKLKKTHSRRQLSPHSLSVSGRG